MIDDSLRARRYFLRSALVAGAAALCTGRPGPAHANTDPAQSEGRPGPSKEYPGPSKEYPAQSKEYLAQAKKYTKERVGYRDEPYEGKSCAKCILYAGHGECAIVQGEVSLNGWCVQWTPATMGSLAGPA